MNNAFCSNCGKQLGTGARFCPYCGIALAALEVPAPPNHIPSAPLGQYQPAGRSSNQTLLLIGGAIAILVVAFLLLRGGGDSASSGGTSGGSTTTSSGSSSGGGSNGGSTSGSTTALPKPIPVNLPAATSPGGSLGAPDAGTDKALNDAIKKSGITIAGTAATIQPMRALKDQSMLILEVDDKALPSSASSANPAASQDLAKLVQVINGTPQVKAANVTRLTYIVYSSDKDGPFTTIMTMPMTVLEGLARPGGAASPDLLKQIQVQIKRGPR
jgi:hypothetical protein